MSLVDSLVKENWLKTERLIKAFRKIERKDFLPADIKHLSEANQALPIGHDQTISQPLVVAFMLELLKPEPGDKVMDIGSGSGWTTALLAQVVGSEGKVVSIEIIPELMKFGKKNVAQYNFIDKGIVEYVCRDGTKGYPSQAPYDKILASASAKKLPSAWKEQIKSEGRIVTPIGSSIWLFIKKEEGFQKEEHSGFAFVPLVSQ